MKFQVVDVVWMDGDHKRVRVGGDCQGIMVMDGVLSLWYKQGTDWVIEHRGSFPINNIRSWTFVND